MKKESMMFNEFNSLGELGKKEDNESSGEKLDKLSQELIETEHKIEVLDEEIDSITDEILLIEDKMVKGDDGISWSTLNANRDSKMLEHNKKDEERNGLSLAKRILEEKIKDIKESQGELTMFRDDSLN